MKIKSIFSQRNFLLLGTILLAAMVPLVFQKNQYVMVLVTTVLLYAILASAWNIIGGMANQFDLGAFAYVGLGAFTAGNLLIKLNLTPWIGMILGGLVATVWAVLIGFPLFGFKVRELWYSLVSIAMVTVLQVGFLMWDTMGGPSEKYLPKNSLPPILSLRFNTYMPYYYIMLVILVIVIYLNVHIRYSKLGYSLLALGEDEDAVEVLGVNSRAAKLKALMIYAFICGVVGGLYACMYGVIHNSYFDASKSVEVSILGIVGGMGVTWGPALAAVVLVSLREFLRSNLSGQFQAAYLIVYAIILILVALYQPRGIAPLIQRGIKKAREYITELRHGHPADT